MLESSMPYKKKLKKDHDIDFDKINEDGRKLGQIIGLKMAEFCPSSLLKLVDKTKLDSQNNETKNSEQVDDKMEKTTKQELFTGEIVSINENKFVKFSIKGESGKITKFFWLSWIKSNLELENQYKSLVGKSISLYYIVDDYFDPRIGEYRTVNIIKFMDTVE